MKHPDTRLLTSKIFCSLLVFALGLSMGVFAQQNKKPQSIGGPEHSTDIYGVRIGMDVPTALEAVFANSNRKPGQEKPDALMKEGKQKRDIRVLYKDLSKGELQIVFAYGKFVKEVVLRYKSQPNADDMRLPFSSSIGSSTSTIYDTSATGSGIKSPAVLDGTQNPIEFGKSRIGTIEDKSAARTGNVDRRSQDLLDGTRYDDRYTVGFFDNQKLQRVWWRDEKVETGFSVRIYFIGKKLTEAGAKFVPSIVQKSIVVKPGDEEKFKAALFK